MSVNTDIVVFLKDGKTKLHFPEDTSEEVIKRVVEEKNIQLTPDKAPPPKDLPWYLDAYEWTKKNMEVPLGLTGSIVGTALGVPFGPPGMIAGGIAGGAILSGTGSAVSDVLEDVPIDYADAVKEAAISAGIDLVTLGAGTKIKSFIQTRKALGISPKETANQLVKTAQEGMAAGSKESLRATQRLLEEGGATLTRGQTGSSTVLNDFFDSIAKLGVASGPILERNAERVNSIIGENLNKLVSKSVVGGLDAASLGEELNTVLTVGRKAMINAYGEALSGASGIKSKIATKSAPTKPFLNRIAAFRSEFGTTENVTKEFFSPGKTLLRTEQKPVAAISELSDPTNKVLNDVTSTFLQFPTLTGNSLITLDKQITQIVSRAREQVGVGGSGIVTADLRQVEILEKTLKEGIQNAIKRMDPEAGLAYQALKKEYYDNMEGLLPEINSSILTGIANNKRGFDVLGKMLTTTQSPEKIEAFMGSIDTAYKLLGKEGASGLTFKTPAEAKNAIKASFLEKSFNLAAFDEVDFSGYRNLVKQWGSKNGRRALAAVFGADTARVMQLTNMMAETSTKADSNFLGLAIKGKEVSTLSAMAQGGIALETLLTSGLGSAAAIIAGPVFLAKASTNPKAVKALLAFEKKKFTSEDALQAAAGAILTNVLADVAIDEREEFKLKLQLEAEQRKEQIKATE